MNHVLFDCILALIGFLIIVYNFLSFVINIKKTTNYFNKGDLDNAIDTSLDIIHSPIKYKKSFGYFLRGNCYLQIGKYTDAFNDLSKSIKILQIPDINMMLMVRFFCKFEEYNKALKYLSKANEFKPNSMTIHLNLGLIYYFTKEYDKAIKSFSTAIKYKGKKITLSMIYSMLGATYTKIKKYDEASENLSKALDMYPKCGLAYCYYANLLRLNGKILLAKENALKSISLNACHNFTYKILAEINLMEDNYIDFYKNFKMFSDHQPVGIDYEDIEDPIYDKVKYDEEFKSLLKTVKEKALTFNNLNIYIDDDTLLSDKIYKKRRIIVRINRVFILLLIIIYIYLIFKK